MHLTAVSVLQKVHQPAISYALVIRNILQDQTSSVHGICQCYAVLYAVTRVRDYRRECDETTSERG
jgi:hypothetical protein